MRPLPELTVENTAFWTGGARGALMICVCDDCRTAIHPPQILCPHCLSRNVAPKAMPGTGTVYSFTVNHQPWFPGMAVPFALAVVDVDGAPGVRVTAEVATDSPETVSIGQRMKVHFVQVEDVWLPRWVPMAQEKAQ
ncbi:Zn-ribbon domain-containing OB-fold protein [Parapedomonas caeni]